MKTHQTLWNIGLAALVLAQAPLAGSIGWVQTPDDATPEQIRNALFEVGPAPERITALRKTRTFCGDRSMPLTIYNYTIALMTNTRMPRLLYVYQGRIQGTVWSPQPATQNLKQFIETPGN
jgi:hypothetical protein